MKIAASVLGMQHKHSIQQTKIQIQTIHKNHWLDDGLGCFDANGVHNMEWFASSQLTTWAISVCFQEMHIQWLIVIGFRLPFFSSSCFVHSELRFLSSFCTNASNLVVYVHLSQLIRCNSFKLAFSIEEAQKKNAFVFEFWLFLFFILLLLLHLIMHPKSIKHTHLWKLWCSVFFFAQTLCYR